MVTDFQFSMDNIPRQRSFACLSLKFGCILTGLIVILYSVLALAQCMAALSVLPSQLDPSDPGSLAMYAIVIVVTITHAVTLFLSTVLLIGAIREKAFLVRPWVIWMSMQVMVLLLLFVFWSTMNMINHYDISLVVYVVEFLGLLIRFYMLMIVNSFYKQLEEEAEESKSLVKLINNDSWYTV
ncbi:unnamed protein product [Diatraea saccharalis]|uniref:Uncharacterized protein n=1 Tax=Diatraea saccharalis TaxID=40085 RepID=A0A9N9R2R7_9NEOP|nr:unnamed protein product [Diatraea saccharalis]